LAEEESNTVDDGLRIEIFRRRLPLDSGLREIASEYPTHFFLGNPAGQNVFLYLTEYVKHYSEHHFRKDFGELRLLDWGCGKGHVSYLLKKQGGNIVSCDREGGAGDSSFGQDVPIMDRYGIDAVPLHHDFLLPFEDGAFDVVVSFGVLEHVPDDRKSIGEIRRVLRRDGLFFCFNLPYNMSWTQRMARMRGDRYHSRLYTKGPLRRMMEEDGFEIADMWHRQLFPKNSVAYPRYQSFERVDQFLTEWTPLRFLATNIEFVAIRHPEGRLA